MLASRESAGDSLQVAAIDNLAKFGLCLSDLRVENLCDVRVNYGGLLGTQLHYVANLAGLNHLQLVQCVPVERVMIREIQMLAQFWEFSAIAFAFVIRMIIAKVHTRSVWPLGLEMVMANAIRSEDHVDRLPPVRLKPLYTS